MAIFVSGNQPNHAFAMAQDDMLERRQQASADIGGSPAGGPAGRSPVLASPAASPASLARRRRACHIRWQRQPDAETGREQICILEVETGEIIAIVRSLFDVWFS